ncbi:hypothetical protein ACTMTI_20135 [Nonomuraea sp. H19]
MTRLCSIKRLVKQSVRREVRIGAGAARRIAGNPPLVIRPAP